MRYIGAKVEVPALPDSVAVFLLAANAAQLADYPTGTDYVRVGFASTGGAALAGVFNGGSGGALWGSSHTATAGSTAADALVPAGVSQTFQRPRSSTGYSVIAPAAGVCHVECWSRAPTSATT